MAETLEQKSVEIVLGDGSKIVGKDLDDALKNAAKRIEDRNKDVKEAQDKAAKLQSDLDAYKQNEEEKKAEADRLAELERQRQRGGGKEKNGFDKAEYYKLLNEDPDAANAMWFKHRFGADPEQLVNNFEQQSRTLNEINQERVASAFWRQHPEFPQEMSAARVLDKRVGQLLTEGHPFNVRTFNMAYDELIGEEAIKPMELDKKVDDKKKDEEDRPNPQLRGSGSDSAEEAEAQRIDKMDEKALEAYGREKGWIR